MSQTLTRSPAPAPGVTPGARSGREARRVGVAALFAGPAVVALVCFVVVPFLLAGLWLSTHAVRLGESGPAKFVGLRYFERLFLPDVPGSLSGQFYGALANNATFAISVVIVQTASALLLAVALNRPGRFVVFLRGVFFLPVVFPMALVAVVWGLVYSPDSRGLLNSVISTVTFGVVGPQDWLGNPSIAMLSIVLLSIWQGVGFQMVIILAGLQGIAPSLYEAAEVDRANAFRRFAHVTVPGLRNTLVFVVLMTTLLALRLFDQVQILTPNNDATRTVMSLAIEQRESVGQAAAVSVVFFAISLLVTLVQRLVLREEREVR